MLSLPGCKQATSSGRTNGGARARHHVTPGSANGGARLLSLGWARFGGEGGGGGGGKPPGDAVSGKARAI